jgi:hypothetical protein
MDNATVLDGIKKDLEAVQQWAAEQIAYVEKGAPENTEVDDLVFYYRYVRTVRCSI